MLVLYHHNISVCAQKVRLALVEKAIAWENRHIDLMRGEQIAPAFLAINPKGVVPAIVHDSAPVIESTVILEYLEDAFPERPLRPAAPIDRAQMRLWIRVPDDGLHASCGTVSYAAAFAAQVKAFHGMDALDKRLARLPDQARAQRQRQLLERGIEAPILGDAVRHYDKALAEMEKTLSTRPWLAGDAFSLAECALAPYVLRLDRLGLSGMWSERPGVAAWYARLQTRKSWAQAIEAYPSLGPEDYDDDLRAQKPGPWTKVKSLLAA